MTKYITFYFQVHQPFRVKHYRVFDIGKHLNYFDVKKNKEILWRVSTKCYLPTNNLILELIKRNKNFKVAYSISGVALEQFEKYVPEVLDSFKDLARTGRVEFLSETYYHSLTFLEDKEEYIEQIEMHKALIKELFKQNPKVFRNTELTYNNYIADVAAELGFETILADGVEKILGWRSPTYLYKAKNDKIKLLLKHYKLSDDIAFRFSNPHWEGYPLTAEKFADWVSMTPGDVVNIFIDYETFGEHQWPETGIFNFLNKLPEELEKRKVVPLSLSEASDILEPKDNLDVSFYVSWADTERDLSAWIGNDMQRAALKEIHKFGKILKKLNNKELLDTWRKLLTSDHFYYMCTKWFADGDIHKYFNAYDTPYEAFITYMNILNDFALRVKKEVDKQNQKLENEEKETIGKKEPKILISDNPTSFILNNKMIGGGGNGF